MMKFVAVCLVAIFSFSLAFVPSKFQRISSSELCMNSNEFKKVFAAGVMGAGLIFGGNSARAEVDYEGIKYLGGGDKIDINNANIRAYLKVPGFYPNLASKIVVNGPFKSVADIYNIPGLSNAEKETLKKAESRLLTLDVKPEYDIDKINNGLYR